MDILAHVKSLLIELKLVVENNKSLRLGVRQWMYSQESTHIYRPSALCVFEVSFTFLLKWQHMISWVIWPGCCTLRFPRLVCTNMGLVSPGSCIWPPPSGVWSGPTPAPAPWSGPWGTPSPGRPSSALPFQDFRCPHSCGPLSLSSPELWWMLHLNLRCIDRASKPSLRPAEVENENNVQKMRRNEDFSAPNTTSSPDTCC